jgi:predicted RNA-binding protein
MRLATVYVAEPGEPKGKESFLTDITTIERKRDALSMTDLYGRHQEVSGFIRKIDFMTLVVVIERRKSLSESDEQYI